GDARASAARPFTGDRRAGRRAPRTRTRGGGARVDPRSSRAEARPPRGGTPDLRHCPPRSGGRGADERDALGRPPGLRDPNAAPARKAARAQLKTIYVLDDRGEMAGEYILDADCPIDYDDFLKVLPPEGIGDRDSLFVGEYVFTAFQSGKVVFVLLSRGHLASEDVDWTALLLTAADSH